MSLAIPRLSGGVPLLGHLLAAAPRSDRADAALPRRVRRDRRDALAGQSLVMLYGEEAQEAFFRAPDEQLDQAAAYPFMKPVFGPGVVFDATPEQRKQALRNRSLRDQAMRGHAEVIAARDRAHDRGLGRAGEHRPARLLRRAHHLHLERRLIGPEFRDELGPELVPLFTISSAAPTPFAYVNPNLPLPVLPRARPRARAARRATCRRIFERREAEGRKSKDLFQILRTIKNPDGSRATTIEHHHRHVHLADVRRTPHHVRPRRPGRCSSCCATPSGCARVATSSTRSTPTAARSATRRCARSRSSRAVSRRRCACTRR